ncbi:hypothetical protein MSG28_011347 [Choristoneura fumiferana]|uniref:Uncharacterized protein n=1 Tax=Choristoneura fumiferana TaxID=7141 RepID=A0ACC0JMY7_CHOFU|nr:hypothetical protein MSG28_011347 [Choristoneura fumiferana]
MVIDENEARLRVRFPLNCEKRRNYKFDIAAVGCDGSYSNTSHSQHGAPGLREVPQPHPVGGTGPLALFPVARLEACSSDERCPGVTRIQAAVTLQASRAGSGCDRDTFGPENCRSAAEPRSWQRMG